MYQVDNQDTVVGLADLPQSSVGAPMPIVLSNEHKVIVAFYLENAPKNWDGSTVRVVGYDSDEPAALVEFKWCYAHMFGPPNDEAFRGHPLAERGLGPYGSYEVLTSSWIRSLERMNSVHHYHKPESFWERHHYILTFHDSTFECVSDGYQVFKTRGSMESILPIMAEKLWTR